MPTTLALAKVVKPKHAQFQDIMPLAKGTVNRSPYKEIYGAYLDAQRSVTVGNEKLLVYPNVPIVRVYDIFRDPFEKKDLAGTKRGKVIASKLFPRLMKLQKQMGDKLDLSKSFPSLTSKI